MFVNQHIGPQRDSVMVPLCHRFNPLLRDTIHTIKRTRNLPQHSTGRVRVSPQVHNLYDSIPEVIRIPQHIQHHRHRVHRVRTDISRVTPGSPRAELVLPLHLPPPVSVGVLALLLRAREALDALQGAGEVRPEGAQDVLEGLAVEPADDQVGHQPAALGGLLALVGHEALVRGYFEGLGLVVVVENGNRAEAHDRPVPGNVLVPSAGVGLF